MYPHDVPLGSVRLSIWNFAFLIAIVAGYPVVCLAFRYRAHGRLPALLPARWLATAYWAALGAQWFAYLFDRNTSLLPPATVSPLRYYFDPLFGPKTLYGAIAVLPVTLLAVGQGPPGYAAALDAWTPAMLTVLAITRVGCFLAGCCYGVGSAWFGLSFPPGSASYAEQVAAGLIAPGAPALPVVPTQALEAVYLAAIAAGSLRALRDGATTIFPQAIGLYSAARFVLEFARADPERNALGLLSTSQWIAAGVLVGLGTWKITSKRSLCPAGGSASRR